MKTSAAGIDLIKQFEGLRLEAYQDVVGIWTIGYGHTGAVDDVPINKGMRIDEAKAEEILVDDLAPREETVTKLVTVPINQNEFDALVSLVFNIGAGRFRKSTVRRCLNAGDRAGAARAFLMWNKADLNKDGQITPDESVAGLTRRREAEKKHFLTPVMV